jgi:hypothetical protein
MVSNCADMTRAAAEHPTFILTVTEYSLEDPTVCSL